MTQPTLAAPQSAKTAESQRRPAGSNSGQGAVPAFSIGIGDLHRHAGNQGVAPLLHARVNGGVLRRTCAECSASGTTCEHCAKESDERVRRTARTPAPSHDPDEAPPIVHDVLARSGQALDRESRTFMEQRIGTSLDGVRIHADADAAQAANAVNARAFAVGNHIVFASGAYAPWSHEGRSLIAHELVHVAQCPGATATTSRTASLKIGDAQDPAEHEADSVAARALSGHQAHVAVAGSTSVTSVRRQPPGAKPVKACVPTARVQTNPEHQLIQEDYLTTLNPGSGAKEFSIPAAGAGGYVGYADLVDLTTFELYEIKSGHPMQILRGHSEVALYEFMAKRHCDKRWRAGKAYPRIRIIPQAVKGGDVLVAGLMSPGLILYIWLPLKEAMALAAATAVAKQAVKKVKKLKKMELDPALTPAKAALMQTLAAMAAASQVGRYLLVVSAEGYIATLGKLHIEAIKSRLAPRSDAQLLRAQVTQGMTIVAIIGAAASVGILVGISGGLAVPAAGLAAAATPALAAGGAGAAAPQLIPALAGATVFMLASAAQAEEPQWFPVQAMPAPKETGDVVQPGTEVTCAGKKCYVVGIAEID